MHPTQLLAAESVLAVVDVQEKLIPRIHNATSLVRNIEFLLDAAALLEVPAVATEQYPRGLGPTVSTLAAKLPSPLPEKVAFSCCGAESFLPDLRARNRVRIVVVGIEAHVCVLHTVLDLLANDFRVYIPVDAVGSRSPLDQDVALRRLEGAGAILTTSETVVFEWLGTSRHPRFKDASALIQRRMNPS